MKALTTAGLTKLIQLIKSSFIKTTDTVTTNTVTLADVATSGDFDDLINQPTIGNGTITFTQGGVTKGTITTNQTGNSTIALDAGGGGTVDQTYDGTSINAQSGVAIAGANFVQNTATGTDALTISGTATTQTGAINIGMSSVAGAYTVALGYNAQASSGTSSGSVVIGTDANSSDVYGIAIGHSASVSTSHAIQLGSGTNSTGGLQVYSYQLLDNTTGLIPDARISSNIARTSQIPSITVDQTFDGTSANAQSGVAIAGAGFLQNTAGASGSLAILGTTSYNYAIALGDSANANDTSAIAIGYSAYANYPQTTALGILAQATAAGTVAIGGNATATAARAHAFGYLSEASASGATALGYEAKATASGALQIGTGTNTTANTLQVSSYTLLDTSTGIIPTARLGTNVDGQWVDADQSIISSATSLNGSTGLTYRVDLPNDGHKYEVMIRGAGYANSTAGNDLWILVTGNQDSMARYMGRARAGTAGTFACIGTVICTMSYVASSEKNLTLSRSTSWNGSCSELKVIAYRRIGSNTQEE